MESTFLRYKPASIVGAWQQAVSGFIKQTPRPLTPKQVGQLKLLYRWAGPYAKQLVTYAVANWSKFAARAAGQGFTEEYAPFADRPAHPHCGFLLKHYDVAVFMMHEEHLLTDADMVWFAKTVWGIDV
jgi:hypothetical protein